ncbi:DUF748 domain-containing protein [Pseudomonas oryzihabitans]|uniref:DUF748 domain-containing protein n=1 Tax=Pseudomonas oryzihabitans TaxID=47885 RepID=A0A1G5PG52_9PSED|nr:DUF748 domain-containing protein [Pseudomonas psychrotolerans]NMY87740.1 DUF748 domain-containing protein [Pseudomonas psychrotolerans]SCZ48502.1 protein of unknown function [Pseudomonas psychrotolerans]
MSRRLRLPLYILIGLVVLLLCLHLAAPLLIRHYLNDKLADMGDYRGQVTDVDLAWWRGAYRIEGLEIVKVNGKVPVPFLKAPSIDIAVSWRSLWQDHAIVGRILFDRPELNFVDGGARKEQSQTGEGTDWQDQVDKLISITLDEVRVVNGRVTFRNFNSRPQVNLAATDVNASLYNLTNAADAQGERIAHFEGKAAVLGSAPLEASARFDPFKDFTDFDFRLRVTDIDLPKLNDFARAYGKFDFRAGSGDVVVEAKAVDGRLSGYVKPLMKNVDIFDWQQDVENRNKNALESAWEAVVGTAQTLLKNQPRDQFATRVDLSGSVKNQDISPLQAFFNILRNAFVQAFSARYDAD